MRIIGFDPGPTKTAYAIVDCGDKPIFEEGGFIMSCHHDLDELLWDNHFDLVAIEQVGLSFNIAARHALNQTARVEGIMVGTTLSRGLPVFEATSFDWRKWLCGKRNAKDVEIKSALAYVVSGMGRTNAHVRDAIGVALYAGATYVKRTAA